MTTATSSSTACSGVGMLPVAVGRLHDDHVGRGQRRRVAQDGGVRPAEVAGEDDRPLGPVRLADPELDDRRAEDVTRVVEGRLDTLGDRRGRGVRDRADLLDRAPDVVDVEQRGVGRGLHRPAACGAWAATAAISVSVTRRLRLAGRRRRPPPGGGAPSARRRGPGGGRCRPARSRPGRRWHRSRTPVRGSPARTRAGSRPMWSLWAWVRSTACNVVGRVRERHPVAGDLLHPALEQPAVDEQPPVTDREQELRAGDAAGGAEESDGDGHWPGVCGRRRLLSVRGLPDRAPDRADARQAPAGDPDRRRVALRAEVGRVSRPRLPGRGRGLHPEPGPQAPEPILPRARGAPARDRPAERPLRARRRDRHRLRGRS